MTASAAEKLNKRGAVGAQSLDEGEKHLVIRRYPKYRAVESRWFEEIPATWDALRAKWLFSNEKDRSDESDEQLAASQKYGVIPQRKMIELNNANVMLALKGTENFKKVRRNDFVISLRSFEGGIEHSLYDGCISPAYTVLRRRSHGVEPSYFRYVLKCDPFIKALNSTSEGIRDGKTITYEEFGELILALPPAEDQGAIAKYLDRETVRIDNLIAEKQNFINLLKEKRQALISHVVTKGLDPKVKMKESGIEWLGEVPEHWGVGRVKHLASIISKGTTPSTIGGEFVEEGVRFLKAENIGKSFFVSESPAFYISESVDEQLARSRLKESDVLVIIAGATTGKCSVITADLLPANTNQAVSFIRPKCKAHSFFIAYWLESKFAQDKIWQDAVQAAQPNLSMEDLGNLNITIPPDEEVEAIVSSITSSCNRLANLENETLNSIELLKEHRTALISAAVTGKIDVREQQ